MSQFIISLFVLISTVDVAFADEYLPLEVETSIGRIQGFRHKLNDSNQEIGIFFGIPYAKPPIGSLRFEKPQPPSRWSGVRAADKPKPACISHSKPANYEDNKEMFSEDCLHLNIFAPIKMQNRIKAPVVLLIHGGAFLGGSSRGFHNYEDIGSKFVAQGILVASLQYRLGWIGFGSTGDSEMPGNLGLWDQLAGLKFLRANVHAFGGDPDRITLYGYSAGSASVSLLSISPHSRDLFNQSIQMSGSPFAAWALNERPVKETWELSRELDCPRWKSIKQCLTEKPVDEIWSAVERMSPTRYGDVNFSKWGPRVDGDFFPMDIPQLIRATKPKRTLMGFVDLESLVWMRGIENDILAAAFTIPLDQLDQYGREEFEQSVRLLVAKPEFFGNYAEEVKRQIVDHYLREDAAMLHQRQRYVQRYNLWLTDLTFIVPVLMELLLKAQLGWPVHFYQNTHVNANVFPTALKVHQNFHTNDLNLLFLEANFRLNFELSDADKSAEMLLVQMITNFIRFGNPSPDCHEWLPVTKQLPFRHLQISANPELEDMLDNEMEGRFAFWLQIIEKYGQLWDPVRGDVRKF